MIRSTASVHVRWASLALAVALVVAACSSQDTSSRDSVVEDAGNGADGVAGTTEAAEAVEEAAAPEPPFAVGQRSLELVDSSRPTDAVPDGGVDGAPDRTIPVELVYPAEGEPTAAPSDDTTDDSSGDSDTDGAGGAETTDGGEAAGDTGPVADAPPVESEFPLVVFAHGANNTGELFVGVAEPLARQGYIVALPTFPLSRVDVAHIPDYVNQPDDMVFVMDEVLALNDDPDDPLAGRIDDEHIAVAGYSLGAATVIGLAYNSCCGDPRIDAAIEIAGLKLPFDGGDYDDRPPTPLLVVHGVQDDTVSIDSGDEVFEEATGPAYYLRYPEADHVSVFFDEDLELLTDASLAFLDAELRGDRTALDDMAATVADSGRADWRVKD